MHSQPPLSWHELSEEARHTMTLMQFRPMYRESSCVFSQTFNRTFHATYLRRMAKHFAEIADWLESRPRVPAPFIQRIGKLAHRLFA